MYLKRYTCSVNCRGQKPRNGAGGCPQHRSSTLLRLLLCCENTKAVLTREVFLTQLVNSYLQRTPTLHYIAMPHSYVSVHTIAHQGEASDDSYTHACLCTQLSGHAILLWCHRIWRFSTKAQEVMAHQGIAQTL